MCKYGEQDRPMFQEKKAFEGKRVKRREERRKRFLM